MLSNFVRGYVLVTIAATTLCWARCITPNRWMGVSSSDTESINYSKSKEKWTNGIVYYHLNKSLSTEDITMIRAAFAEYHQKTCIRFREKSSSNHNYVSIEFDPDLDGAFAHTCMKGGYQFLKFGPESRNPETVIHELGHTLCLGHEHQRKDRDDYVSVNKDCSDSDSYYNSYYDKFTKRPVRGLYDYASQMHYQCDKECLIPKNGVVNKCGEQVNKGLSVLDADYINELYNCSGCFGHRWLPRNETTNSYYSNVFEYFIPGACRTMLNGEIVVGTYKSDMCLVYNNKSSSVNMVRNNFEILGLSWGYRNYYFINVDSDTFSTLETKKLLAKALPGGYHINAVSGHEPSYIGYARINHLDTWLTAEQQVAIGNRSNESLFGPVWEEGGSLVSFFSVAGKQFPMESYNILTCDLAIAASSRLLTPIYEQPFVKPILGDLVRGSTITIIGQFNRGVFSFYILTEKGLTLFLSFRNSAIIGRNRIENEISKITRTRRPLPFKNGEIFKLIAKFEESVITLFLNNVAIDQVPLAEPLVRTKRLVIFDLDVYHVDIKLKNNWCNTSQAKFETPKTATNSSLKSEMSNKQNVNSKNGTLSIKQRESGDKEDSQWKIKTRDSQPTPIPIDKNLLENQPNNVSLIEFSQQNQIYVKMQIRIFIGYCGNTDSGKYFVGYHSA